MLATSAYDLAAVRSQIVGLGTMLPRREGAPAPAINLDNATTTPALRQVQTTVERFLEVYSSVQRGSGLKAQATSAAYEQARAVVGRFVGARPGQHQVVFTRNTTEALNLLARRLSFAPDQLVISTALEHHSNDLPWRGVAPVVYVATRPNGALDEEHYAELLHQFSGRVRLVAVTGGSNVTGYLPPLPRLATLAHAHGAEIVVDAAQVAAHRRIDLGELRDPAHLDYVALSGHKLYAPYGAGALIGRADRFVRGAPMLTGGGSVRRVTPRIVDWADGPAREEAGTPNAVGVIALAAACLALEALGLAAIATHEAALTAYALTQLRQVPGLSLFGDPEPSSVEQRLGVIPFCLDNYDSHLVAAMLSYEAGIAVRSGSFCAQPYVRHLLKLDQASCEQGQPGLVRASFGLYTSENEVDALITALRAISAGTFEGLYERLPEHGGFQPIGWKLAPEKLFQLDLSTEL